jgi:hypothetical protein
MARAFRMRRPDETHRARLRVEIGRLRVLIAPLACIEATGPGYALAQRGGREPAHGAARAADRAHLSRSLQVRERAQRWLAPPLAGFTTILLLPPSLPLA